MTTVSEFDLTAALREVHAKITTKVGAGEFTTKDYAEVNGVPRQAAVTFVNEGVKSGLIIFVGQRTIVGHATNIYRLKSAPEVL